VRAKLEYLRHQAETYWRDAENATTEAEAMRLVILAIRCHGEILALEYEAPESVTLH
jgi:hypothetical protein